MCNLYSQTKPQQAVRDLFQVRPGDDHLGNLPPFAAIWPAMDAPVVRMSKDGARELVMVNWGFMREAKGKAPGRIINARNLDAWTWKRALDTPARRCLVPATSFCEFTTAAPFALPDLAAKGRKTPVWFGLKPVIDDDRPLFAFAGLWRRWKGALKPGEDPVELEVFAMLTAPPNALVRPVHPQAMPVILAREDWDTWLNAPAAEAKALQRPFPAQAMAILGRGPSADEPDKLLAVD